MQWNIQMIGTKSRIDVKSVDLNKALRFWMQEIKTQLIRQPRRKISAVELKFWASRNIQSCAMEGNMRAFLSMPLATSLGTVPAVLNRNSGDMCCELNRRPRIIHSHMTFWFDQNLRRGCFVLTLILKTDIFWSSDLLHSALGRAELQRLRSPSRDTISSL